MTVQNNMMASYACRNCGNTDASGACRPIVVMYLCSQFIRAHNNVIWGTENISCTQVLNT
jgi:hypothetical protein